LFSGKKLFVMDISNTVLLVDEDEVMHYLVQIILNKFKTTGKSKSVSSGEEALEYLQKNASENNFPKLIVTSLTLGNPKEIDLIKSIVGMKYYSSGKTEIIVLTPNPTNKLTTELKALGVSQVLKRPELPEGFSRLRS
jgi:CheY-like chemotaxis protein